MKLFTLLGLAN